MNKNDLSFQDHFTDHQRLFEKVQNSISFNSSIHGVKHWVNVDLNGKLIANYYGIDPHLITCFALLHDSQRVADTNDPEHGERAAAYIKRLGKEFLKLSTEQFEILYEACYLHARGYTTTDITIGACWDADRLDLVRINIRPSKNFLSTTCAKELAGLV